MSPAKLSARFDRKFIVHHNRYVRFGREELDAMHEPLGVRSFAPRAYENGAQSIVQRNYLRKFTAGFAVEMTRSVREWLKGWQEGSRAGRDDP